MKASHQSKTKSAGPAKAAAKPRVQPKIRTGAGNHHRQRDSFERQADDIATRVVRGESGVSRLIDPTAAANYWLPSSMGSPLPAGLRTDLELSFGADFSAVRIHTDSFAADSVADVRARAFASGRDIFFNRGQFSPSTPSGKFLLAHELAHVLQQTGRVGSGGRLRATSVQSSGMPQFDGTMPDFSTLKKLHAPKSNKTATTKFESIAAELAKISASADPGTGLETFFTGALPNIKDWSEEAESLLYDTLKLHEKYDLAAQLIERDDFKGGARIRTAVWTGELVASLEKRNKAEAVYPIAVEKNAALAFYYAELSRLVEVFIFKPANDPIPQMRRFGTKEDDPKAQTIEDHATELSANLDENTKLSSNEWIYSALFRLNRLNRLRRDKCIEINNAAVAVHDKTDEQIIFIKRRFAEGVRDWGAKYLESTKDIFNDDGKMNTGAQTAWAPLLKKLGAAISKIGRDALTAWDSSRAFDELFRAYYDAKDDAARVATAKKLTKVKTLGEQSGLPDQLVRSLKELNQPGTGGESPASQYEFAERLTGISSSLYQYQTELENGQAALFHNGKTDDLLASLWLAVWVHDQVHTLNWLIGGTAGPKQIELVDQRIIERLRFARRFRWLANALGWTTVVEAANVIITAKNEKQSVLAILPFSDGKYWHYDDKAPIEDLAKIPTVKGWQPFTGEHLALLYRKAYYDDLAKMVKTLTPATDADEKKLVDSGLVDPFIAGRADKLVRQQPFPEFWKVNRSDFAIKENSKEDFTALIFRHPSYRELYDHKTQTGMDWILPVAPGSLWAWFIPPIEKVVPTLRAIELLNGQVASTFTGEKTEKDRLAKAGQLSDRAWLNVLDKLIEDQLAQKKLSPESLISMRAAIQTSLSEKRDESWNELLKAVKKGSRLDRQLIANWSLDHLRKYDDDHHRYDEPMKALEPIIRFFVAVSMLEDKDMDAEMTCLMLELAPTMASAFEYEQRFDVVHAYLGWLETAVNYLPTLKAMSKEERHVFLPDYQNTDDWIKSHETSLLEVTDHFKAVRESVQKKSGYKASATDQTFKVFMAYSSPLPVGLKLYPREGQSILGEPKSVHYVVTKILKDFIFHPSYGYAQETPATKKSKKKTVVTGYSKQKILQFDDKTPLELAKSEKLLEVRILNRKEEEIARKQIGPEDVDILDDIHNGLAWSAFGSAMGNIEAGIEWAVNTMLDLAEFIPGVGQGVAAARILATIAQFWAEGDYDQIKKFVSGEIFDIVDGLLQRIKDAADPENLVQLLLFGDQRLDELFAHSTIGKGKDKPQLEDPPDNKGKFGKIKKIIAGFRRLGRALFKALRALHDRVQVPMEDFHAYAASRPLLSFALQFIADNIQTIISLAKAGYSLFTNIGSKEDKGKGVADQMKDMLKQQQEGFSDRLHDILKQLETLKLPDNIINISPIVSAILDFLEGFVVKRLGLKAKAAFFILQKTGALSFFNERVADEIVKAGIDPNIYWREQVIPEIEGRFNDTRDTVVGEINKLIASPIFGGAFTQVKKADKLSVQAEGGPFKETGEDYDEQAPATNPYPSLDRPLKFRPDHVPSHGPGNRLTPEIRQHVESVFQQDFGHVRLHSSSDSKGMTDAFGADALTTGSHIFMRPGLNPTQGRGADVFHHELAHVVQQSGTRPLNAGTSQQPKPGKPQAGLSYDPARERVADRVADVVRKRKSTPEVGSAGPADDGLQPSGLNLFTIAKLLHSITDLPEIKKREEILDKITTQATLPSRAHKTVDKTLAILANLQGNTALLKFPDVFTDAVPLIHNRLQNKAYADPIKLAAFEIAREALFDLPTPKPTAAQGSTTPQSPAAEQVMKPSHFARQLEGYILAKTGIVLGLTLNHTKVTAPTGAEIETVDDQNPIKEIKILHIYLPYIDGRSPLWIKAIENTWPGADEKKLTKIRIQLRAHFERKGVVIGIWALFGKKYTFSFFFKKEVDDLVAASITGTALDPKDLPTWEDYAETDKDHKSTIIGVRLATYDHGSQKGAGRHSHHLTQYLIADFFSNTNTLQPFVKGRDYPGVKVGKDAVELIAIKPNETSRDKAIYVAETKGEGRGKDMPTISLAASTHMSGRLHVTPEADDLNNSTKKSQAGAVQNEFNRHMPADLLSTNAATFNKYKKEKGDDEVAKTIYTAVQRTYKEVERRMSEALQARMPMLEFEYFKEMAKGTPNEIADPTNPDHKTDKEVKFLDKLTKVAGTAKKHNHDLMLNLGWRVDV
ncbi:MAG TPA: DUF4157 domain-containing protein [Pyrinomonadaceae bacterium]